MNIIIIVLSAPPRKGEAQQQKNARRTRNKKVCNLKTIFSGPYMESSAHDTPVLVDITLLNMCRLNCAVHDVTVTVTAIRHAFVERKNANKVIPSLFLLLLAVAFFFLFVGMASCVLMSIIPNLK